VGTNPAVIGSGMSLGGRPRGLQSDLRSKIPEPTDALTGVNNRPVQQPSPLRGGPVSAPIDAGSRDIGDLTARIATAIAPVRCARELVKQPGVHGPESQRAPGRGPTYFRAKQTLAAPDGRRTWPGRRWARGRSRPAGFGEEMRQRRSLLWLRLGRWRGPILLGASGHARHAVG